MRTLLTALSVVALTGAAVLATDLQAKPTPLPKTSVSKKVPIIPTPSELLPLRIDDDAGLLVCKRNKECKIKGRLGAGHKVLLSLAGDDGKRRFALATSGGWKQKEVTFKIPPSVPLFTFHTLSIVDLKEKRLSNGIRVLVQSTEPCTTGGADIDGDGHDAPECAGDDCDDHDANRFPGNSEVCDTKNHDEDCDPQTFGYRDGDGDGFPDASCCNDGNCGWDCDDARRSVHSIATETCNKVDDDCDGWVDEAVQATVFFDSDKDLYGDPGKSKKLCIHDIGSGWVL